MGSIAHATMLAKVGVLSDAERDAIVDGLQQIQAEIEAGSFDWRVDLEDVHMNIEARLTDRIGVTGKKLHTVARATTRWPPTSASGYATRSTPSSPRSPACRRACWAWPKRKPTPSCPVSPTCRPPSR
ncbi:argininosuccinate lyase [Pseudomonas aeruginosa]|nr:argininosuccinate lyase [Pseudomonas aeruginosa]